MEVYICAIIACDKRGFFVINTMFIFRYFSNDVLLVSVSTCVELFARSCMYTAISRKVVGKSARDNHERYCGWF